MPKRKGAKGKTNKKESKGKKDASSRSKAVPKRKPSKSKAKVVAAAPDLKVRLTGVVAQLSDLVERFPQPTAAEAEHGQMIEAVFFDIGDTLLTRSSSGDSFDWLPGASELITKLVDSNIAVGVISNTGNLSRSTLQGMFPAGFFDRFSPDLIVLSSEVQVEKPNLAIFYLALGRARRTSAHCLFIGENLVETYVAQLAGLRSFRIGDAAKDFGTIQRLVLGDE